MQGSAKALWWSWWADTLHRHHNFYLNYRYNFQNFVRWCQKILTKLEVSLKLPIQCFKKLVKEKHWKRKNKDGLQLVGDFLHWKYENYFWFKYQLHISLIVSAPTLHGYRALSDICITKIRIPVSFSQNATEMKVESECWKVLHCHHCCLKKCLTQTQDWDSQGWRRANFWHDTLKTHLICLLSWCRTKVSVTFLSTGNVNITNPINRDLTSSLHNICLCFIISMYSSQYLTWISLAAF